MEEDMVRKKKRKEKSCRRDRRQNVDSKICKSVGTVRSLKNRMNERERMEQKIYPTEKDPR